MIHVSGGAYIRTSLLNEDPDGLIEHDIIFVSVTYRLHILGKYNLEMRAWYNLTFSYKKKHAIIKILWLFKEWNK